MIVEIPYPESVPDLFETISDLPWPVFLDSAGLGRYDILAAAPFATLVTKNGRTEISDRSGNTLSMEDPFDLLRKMLLPLERENPLPFMGGAIGYFGYDLGLALNGIDSMGKEIDFPDLVMGIYDWAIVVDHLEKTTHLAANCRDPETRRIWKELLARLSSPARHPRKEAFRLTGKIEAAPPFDEYGIAFAKIKGYITSGDCYQANLAQCFQAPYTGDPWTLYRAFRAASPAPYSAYFSNPHCRILSASPERFLELRGSRVQTEPIKGTRPRSIDPMEDARLAQSLAESPKDRAENLMIVDLLRNDLGKVCATGTVRVEKLFEIEHFASVHHMVSTISGHLDASHDAISLLKSTFPGGSITGAPKIRAMEIIEELEPFRRGPYCGAMARIGFDGNMDSSIMIRTLAASGNKINLWAGGGIVADSERDAEYQEIRHKANVLLSLMESTLPSC